MAQLLCKIYLNKSLKEKYTILQKNYYKKEYFVIPVGIDLTHKRYQMPKVWNSSMGG